MEEYKNKFQLVEFKKEGIISTSDYKIGNFFGNYDKTVKQKIIKRVLFGIIPVLIILMGSCKKSRPDPCKCALLVTESQMFGLKTSDKKEYYKCTDYYVSTNEMEYECAKKD